MQFRNLLRMLEILLQLAPTPDQIIQYSFEISLISKAGEHTRYFAMSVTKEIQFYCQTVSMVFLYVRHLNHKYCTVQVKTGILMNQQGIS